MREAGPVGRRRGHAQKLRVSETCPDQDRPAARIADPVPASMTAHVVNVVLSGVFHASILFLVSAGIQVVFCLDKMFNLACGSFFAVWAYAGGSAARRLPAAARAAPASSRASCPTAASRG